MVVGRVVVVVIPAVVAAIPAEVAARRVAAVAAEAFWTYSAQFLTAEAVVVILGVAVAIQVADDEEGVAGAVGPAEVWAILVKNMSAESAI